MKDWTAEERARIRADAPTTALKTPFRNITVRTSRLKRCASRTGACADGRSTTLVGRDETQYLAPLFQIAEADFTPAADLLCAYTRRWDHSVNPVFEDTTDEAPY